MSSSDLKRIDHIVQTLQKSKLGNVLIEFGIFQEVQINWVENVDFGGRYYYDFMGGHSIDLNVDCDDHTLIAVLAHELRHCEQFMALDILSLTQFKFEDALVLQRYIEADACAYSSAVCYDLAKITGDKKYLELDDMYNDNDILSAMISSMTAGHNLNKDKTPYQTAFNQWFKDKKRIKLYDDLMVRAFEEEKNSLFGLIVQKNNKRLTQKLRSKIGVIGPRFNYLTGKGGLDLKKNIYTRKPAF